VNWHETRAVGALSASSLQFKTSGLLLFKALDASVKGATLPELNPRPVESDTADVFGARNTIVQPVQQANRNSPACAELENC